MQLKTKPLSDEDRSILNNQRKKKQNHFALKLLETISSHS